MEECLVLMDREQEIKRYKQEIEELEFQRSQGVYILRAIREQLAKLEKWQAHREEH